MSKFAVPFRKDFKFFQDNPELNIHYKPKIKELDTFISNYSSYRINFIFNEEFDVDRDLPILLALKEKYKDMRLAAALPKYTEELESLLSSNQLPHYYQELIGDWDRFRGFLTLDVTDIFITGELCFSLYNVSDLAIEAQKSLRCYCNICQTSWPKLPSSKTFFIRPEDIPLYENYINVFEFYFSPEEKIHSNKLNILYKIYHQEQKWRGNLAEIISGFNESINNAYIIPKFGERRINCDKRCLHSYSSCHICDRIIELAESLKDHQIVIS